MLSDRTIELLEGRGVSLSPEAHDRARLYVDLLRQHNDQLSLVSMGDAAKLEDLHIPDSLSLLPVLKEALQPGSAWIDIGSGGGMPAIPLKIACPELPLTLVERSVKKAEFLRHCVQALRLEGEVVSVQFPQEFPHPAGHVVMTARAVEKAADLHRRLATWMKKGDVFLCQAGTAAAFAPAVFHVEQVQDAWTSSGLRRGNLWKVTRR